MMNNEGFGEYMRRLREEKNMTLRKLQDLSGVSAAYITYIENGRRRAPSPQVLRKLASPLGVSLADLMLKVGHVDYDHLFNEESNPEENEIYSNSFYAQVLGFPNREAYLEHLLSEREDLTRALENKHLTFRGHLLTTNDRKRILLMLDILFPDYTPQSSTTTSSHQGE